jgi:predicted RNase H-like HicB family nuclease
VSFFKHKSAAEVIEVPVLCRFWMEDGVWNGEAVDLPVAVYGDTFEQARQHLGDAIVEHLSAVQQVGNITATIHVLRSRMNEALSMAEFPRDNAMMRMSATFRDNRVAELV